MFTVKFAGVVSNGDEQWRESVTAKDEFASVEEARRMFDDGMCDVDVNGMDVDRVVVEDSNGDEVAVFM